MNCSHKGRSQKGAGAAPMPPPGEASGHHESRPATVTMQPDGTLLLEPYLEDRRGKRG